MILFLILTSSKIYTINYFSDKITKNFKQIWILLKQQRNWTVYKIIGQKASTQQKCIFTRYIFRSHMDHHQV
jgi:hypothetical protein